MKNSLKQICILVVLISISAASFAKEVCLSFDADNEARFSIDMSKDKQFINIKSLYGTNNVYCHQTKDEKGKISQVCSGDDDGGEFIVTEEKVELLYLRLGHVTESFKVLKPSNFKNLKVKGTCE